MDYIHKESIVNHLGRESGEKKRKKKAEPFGSKVLLSKRGEKSTKSITGELRASPPGNDRRLMRTNANEGGFH